MKIFDWLFGNNYSQEKIDCLKELLARSYYEGLMKASSNGGYINKNNGTSGALDEAWTWAHKKTEDALRELK